MRYPHLNRNFLLYLIAIVTTACTSSQPQLQAIDTKVELDRFMGDWYVIASIPIDFWFASEAGGHNGVETYQLRDDGKIATTYTFRQDSFDGEEKQFTPVAWVHNKETNAEWRMQFMWPFRSAYLIAYLDEDYEQTVIGVPNRTYVWIMTRSPEISEDEYNKLVSIVGELGYDTSLLQRVPQRWPEEK
ncbi:MAG: lipocalin family protein [Gammaproteobacteria bacterium]